MGTELLLGQIVDTNSATIAKAVSTLGINIFRKTTVGDNLPRIKKALGEALSRAELVIISGGLGPTEDDVTKQAVSEFFGKKLSPEKSILEKIQEKFTHRQVSWNAILKQSMVPASAKTISNPVGTAPGIIIEERGKTVILLPGVPEELKAMIPQVMEYLSGKIESNLVIKSRTLKVCGIGESRVNEKIAPLMSQTNPTVALLAKKGEVHIRITARFSPGEVDRKIENTEKIIREKLGDYIFGTDEDTLEKVVGELLIKKKITLSVAESCSGGLVCERLTNIPGISAVFLCGLVAYSNRAKTELLNISPQLIKEKGAVSSEVAKKMAKGIRDITGSDVSIGITGIAGPGGGTPEKPVGLVYIALDAKERSICNRYFFSGKREVIKWKTSQEALDLLRRYLLGISC